MKKTTTYQLNQWDKSDRIQMEDFNSDNAKVEQALTAQAEAQSTLQMALANCGNCEIYTTSYTGTGTGGSAGKNSLTFPKQPLLVSISSTEGTGLCVWSGPMWCIFPAISLSCTTSRSADQKTLYWYSDSASSQLNKSGVVFYVTALMRATE